MSQKSHMAREIDEIPEAVARLAAPAMQAILRTEADRLRALDPAFLMTLARGSSDHAATYLAYGYEYLLGLPVVSVRPSLRSVFGRDLRVKGAVCLAVSQSGKSADLVDTARSLRQGGARVLALTNADGSPLEVVANARVATCAGKEQAVPATKSVVTSIVAGLWIAAHWGADEVLSAALDSLPGDLERLPSEGFPVLEDVLTTCDRAVVIARGAGLGLAAEVALKLQETCGIFAVAYSAAEFLHGPSAIVGRDTPVIVLGAGAGAGIDEAMARLETLEALVFRISSDTSPRHPLTDPLLALPRLYHSIEAATRARGMSPDAPFHLKKETITR